VKDLPNMHKNLIFHPDTWTRSMEVHLHSAIGICNYIVNYPSRQQRNQFLCQGDLHTQDTGGLDRNKCCQHKIQKTSL